MTRQNYKILNIIEYIFAFFIILECISVWNVSVKPYYPFTPICGFICIFLWGYAKIIFHDKIFLNKASIFLLILFLVYFALTVHSSAIGFVFPLFVLGLPFMVDYLRMCIKYGRGLKLFFTIEKLIILLSVISVILWILGPLFNLIKENCVINDIRWGDYTYFKGYYYLLFNTQLEDGTFLKSEIYRNSSIFAEGPIFNLWLMYSLCVEIFIKEKKSNKNIVIILIAMMTVFSTTGIIYFILCISLVFISKIINIHSNILRIFFYLILICVIYYLYGIVSDVLTIKSGSSESYSIRMNDYAAGLAYIKTFPILGTGFGNQSNMLNALQRSGFSNSIFGILTSGGIYVGTILLCPILYNIIKGIIIKDYKRSFTFILIIYQLITTLFYNRFLMILYISLAYVTIFYYSNFTYKNHEQNSNCSRTDL